jgi:hypothetical protein
VDNDYQDHSIRRGGYPDFSFHTLNLFSTNDADQRRLKGIQEADQLSCLDLSVPYWVYCSRRRRQIGLDVVDGALNK